MMKLLLSLCTILTFSAASVPLAANDAGPSGDFFRDSTFGANIRYRLESVDQDGFSKNATASTLRPKVWFKTASLGGFSGYIEGEGSFAIGKRTFNDTVNGNASRPVVADPENFEISQAYLTFKSDRVTLQGGRIAVNLDNMRFVGTVGWRQNDQDYDMGLAVITPAKNFTVIYGYVWNVNRIFGNDHPFGDLDTDTQIVNLSYSGLGGLGKLTLHALLIDLNDAPVFSLSSQTVGVRFAGKQKIEGSMSVGYEFEYAKQSDYADNPSNYTANYWHVATSVSSNGLSVGLGYESLGSDNGVSFKTPLATLHKFNGFADKFLATPGAGLRDLYASVGYTVGKGSALSGLSFKLIYHDFTSVVGDTNYGSELDWVVSKKLTKIFTVVLKGAHYNAEAHATDTTKIWLQIVAKI